MSDVLTNDVARLQAFNRDYARHLAMLEEGLVRGDFNPTEVRVLLELACRDGVTAADLCRLLRLNAGYVSRLLAGLEMRGVLARRPAVHDARASVLVLTDAGRTVSNQLDAAASAAGARLLGPLSAAGRAQLVEAMEQIRRLLSEPGTDYVLRDPRPGDMGWVVHRHGALYAREYGWNTEFEALVADIVARYLREHDARTERCWIAECAGTPVGSVLVVRHDAQTAKLRLLYVDASARGRGIGRRLVDEAIAFAAAVGYRRMVLWTNAALVDAGRLFAEAGFELLTEQPEQLFGKPQVSQLWARTL
jgi:DNA-binding MarR family transcriptional regulator/GNAT superfamily N-acetyltransferase